MRTQTQNLLKSLPDFLQLRVELLSTDTHFEEFSGDEIRMLAIAKAIFESTTNEVEAENLSIDTLKVQFSNQTSFSISTDALSLARKIACAMHKDERCGICMYVSDMHNLENSEVLKIESIAYLELGRDGFIAFPRKLFISNYLKKFENNRV